MAYLFESGQVAKITMCELLCIRCIVEIENLQLRSRLAQQRERVDMLIVSGGASSSHVAPATARGPT